MNFKENLERILKGYREKKEKNEGKSSIESYPIASSYSPYIFNKLNEYFNTARDYVRDYYKRRRFSKEFSYS